ncbi:MAG TPA: hypothetical protein DEA46_04140 [Candidatus Moranbacteria bacterium]|nr:hypothetical protein [Candidatus Moranbacteria bacterium]
MQTKSLIKCQVIIFNIFLNLIAAGWYCVKILFGTSNYWSATENSTTNARNVNFNDGNSNNNNKTNSNSVRCVRG